MNKVIILFFLSFSIFSFGQTNTYQTVIGIKGGFPGYGSINVKHGLAGSKYIDASLGGLSIRSFYGNGLYLHGNLVINNNLSNGFLWFYGAGAMVGYSSSTKILAVGETQRISYFQLAPNAVAGLEYVFEDLPLNISLETGPYLFISPNINFVWGGGLALRYVVK